MTKHVEGKVIVLIRINYSTPVLAAGVAAVAIAAAPSAAATPDQQPCSDMGGSTQCQSAGNVQIYTRLHVMPVTPRTAYGPFEGYHAGHN
jgi:hypothetical protein